MTIQKSLTDNCILVTGASGFIGTHFTRALIKMGCKVVAMTHRHELPADVKSACVRIENGDLRDDNTCKRAVEDVDVVCHLSAYIPQDPSDPNEAEACYSVNALATLQLARRALSSGVKRFICLSTANMYVDDTRGLPSTESHRIYPTNVAAPYFVSKYAGEIYLQSVTRNSSMDALVLRIATPYGPGEPRNKVIPTFLDKMHKGMKVRVAFGGIAKYSYIHVADVAECLIQATQTGGSGIYNVASGEHTSILELAKLVQQVTNSPRSSLDVQPSTPDSFRGFPPISIDKLTQTWAMKPRTLRRGLEQYHQYLIYMDANKA